MAECSRRLLVAVIVMAITCNADSCIPQIHLYLEMHILGTLIDSPGGPRAISLWLALHNYTPAVIECNCSCIACVRNRIWISIRIRRQLDNGTLAGGMQMRHVSPITPHLGPKCVRTHMYLVSSISIHAPIKPLPLLFVSINKLTIRDHGRKSGSYGNNGHSQIC